MREASQVFKRVYYIAATMVGLTLWSAIAFSAPEEERRREIPRHEERSRGEERRHEGGRHHGERRYEEKAHQHALKKHTIPYRPVLSGVGNFTLRDLIIKNADVFTDTATPPRTIAELKERASRDMPAVVKALNLAGYYNAQVDYSLDLSTTPITLNFMVHLGEPYKITKFDFTSSDPDNLVVKSIAFNMAQLGIAIGHPADMSTIKSAIKKAFVILGNQGYPYAKVKHEKAVVDHTSQGLEVTVEVDPGPLTRFDDTEIKAEPSVDKNFIKARLQWQAGQVYSNELVMQTVEVLNNTGLYSYVKISRPPTPASNGGAKMTIEVITGEERPLGWKVGSDGSAGVGGSVGWRGRNVFGEGDAMKVEGEIGVFRTGLFFEHKFPDFIWPESSLTTSIDINRTHWTAYRQFAADFAQTITTPLIDRLTGHIGYKFSISNLTPHGVTLPHSPVLVSAPMGVTYNTFDDQRSPRKGWSAKLDLFPYLDIAPTTFFFQASLEQQMFYPLTKDKRLVVSGWYTVGVSPSAGSNALPLNRRFFVGGLGTVKGYALQMAGDLDTKDMPVGGRSMLALGVQLKYYFTERLAGVGFIDVGTAFSSRYPNLAHKIFASMGGGFRYKTDIGDLYFDLAIPTNRRLPDKKAQLYVGIGQAI